MIHGECNPPGPSMAQGDPVGNGAGRELDRLVPDVESDSRGVGRPAVHRNHRRDASPLRRHSAVAVAVMSDNTRELTSLSDEERRRVIAEASRPGLLEKGGCYYVVWTEGGRIRERSTGTADRRGAEIALAEFIHGYGAESVIRTEIPAGQCCHPDCNNQVLYEICLKLSVRNRPDSLMSIGREACQGHRDRVLATAKKERSVKVICRKWERPTQALKDDVKCIQCGNEAPYAIGLSTSAGFTPIDGSCESHRKHVLAAAKREWLIEIIWRARSPLDSESTSDSDDTFAAIQRTIVVDQDGSEAALAREARRRDFLVREIKTYAQSVEWEGKPTGVDRFVKNGLAAIAWYVRESKVRERVRDRQPKAEKLFARGAKALKSAAAVLEKISGKPELSSYLTDLYMNRPKPSSICDQHGAADGEIRPDDDEEHLRRWTAQREAYQEISPANTARSMMHLEPVLRLAAERLKWKPGDYQKKPAAKVFVEEMIMAWVSGTGKIPTCATPNPRSKNDSAFLAILKRINSEIFKVEGVPLIRDIVSAAQTARREIKARYPGL
jgi:hypothetical protein